MSTPLRRIAGEREGEVVCRRLRRCAAAHLTPALSPRKAGGEGDP
jgi:hypothetical protein